VVAGCGGQPACNYTFTIEGLHAHQSAARRILVRALGMNWPSQRIPAKSGRQMRPAIPEQTENPLTAVNVTVIHAGLGAAKAFRLAARMY